MRPAEEDDVAPVKTNLGPRADTFEGECVCACVYHGFFVAVEFLCSLPTFCPPVWFHACARAMSSQSAIHWHKANEQLVAVLTSLSVCAGVCVLRSRTAWHLPCTNSVEAARVIYTMAMKGVDRYEAKRLIVEDHNAEGTYLMRQKETGQIILSCAIKVGEVTQSQKFTPRRPFFSKWLASKIWI